VPVFASFNYSLLSKLKRSFIRLLFALIFAKLKALSGENKGESKLVSSTGIALVLGRWTFFYNFKRPASWILKNFFLPPLEPQTATFSPTLQIIWHK
jgi:hypothetical protein